MVERGEIATSAIRSAAAGPAPAAACSSETPLPAKSSAELPAADISPSSAAERSISRRRLLDTAIEEHWPDLLTGIRIYIRRFGLSTDSRADDMLARDLLQDTVLAALESADRFDPDRAPRPWLLGIAINCIRRARRDRFNEQKRLIPVAETPEARAAGESLSEDELFGLLYESTAASRAPARETLEEMLSPLAEGDRTVLKLHFEEDLRGKDLAAALGVSEGQAWARLSRAKDRLRQAYGAKTADKKADAKDPSGEDSQGLPPGREE